MGKNKVRQRYNQYSLHCKWSIELMKDYNRKWTASRYKYLWENEGRTCSNTHVQLHSEGESDSNPRCYLYDYKKLFGVIQIRFWTGSFGLLICSFQKKYRRTSIWEVPWISFKLSCPATHCHKPFYCSRYELRKSAKTTA